MTLFACSWSQELFTSPYKSNYQTILCLENEMPKALRTNLSAVIYTIYVPGKKKVSKIHCFLIVS